jgi:hypothetical protein
MMWANSLPQMRMALSFKDFSHLGINGMLLQNLEGVGAYTLALDYYHQGKPGGLSLGDIARMRWALQQQLLLLPTAQEIKGSLSERSFYECCRVTLLIFGLAVIFIATSDSYAHLQTLVTRLKIWLEKLYIHGYGTNSAHLLLWMLIIGGIAALDKPERPWFVSRLASLIQRLDITWDDTQEILEGFLWLESACGAGARELWTEVVNSSSV